MMAIAAPTIAISKPYLLVVEGQDEKRFFEAIISHLGLQNIQVMPIGGKTKLRENLRALVSAPGFAGVVSLGVVRDADNDPDAAFRSVTDALGAAELAVPERLLVPAGERPRVSVMVLPEQGVPRPHNMSKARAHVFLASREEPDKRLGEAAEAGYWPWDNEAFDHLKAFLRQIGSGGTPEPS